MPCCRNESSRGRDQPPRSDNPASRCFGATILPQGVYDEYVQRGESENRNKELKIDLCGERLSDHRFVANLFRLLMHATALNLIIRLRRRIVAVLHAPMPNVPARPPVLNSVVLNRRRGVYG